MGKFCLLQRVALILVTKYKSFLSHELNLSLNSDIRVIWGGSVAVKKISGLKKKINCKDIIFGPKVSLAYISKKKIKTEKDLKIFSDLFVNDVFNFDQLGCNSPHNLIVEKGTKGRKEEERKERKEEKKGRKERKERNRERKEREKEIKEQRKDRKTETERERGGEKERKRKKEGGEEKDKEGRRQEGRSKFLKFLGETRQAQRPGLLPSFFIFLVSIFI